MDRVGDGVRDRGSRRLGLRGGIGLLRRQVGDEHKELVGRVASHEVHRSSGLAQPAGGVAQQLVPAGRAESLVDEAEAVEIDVQDGHVPARSPGAIDSGVHLRR